MVAVQNGHGAKAKTVMVQGTGSSVGKSLLVTALCRIFHQEGYAVAPFKAQNMSLNSAVTPDGAEIGRAQMAQAEAARVLPAADMNPVLLKPEGNSRSQLIVMGRPVGHIGSRSFGRPRPGLWDAVSASLDRLRAEYDVVVIEGAGSPAEINLRGGDIVNMEVALYARAPVLLVGDIDKGGVFASLYGTMLLLSESERELVKGTVINKFRGDRSILEPGLRQLEGLTGVPVMGVVPYFTDIHVPEEDSPAAYEVTPSADAAVDVAVVALPHIANFDDFDPIGREAGVGLRYARSLTELGTPDLLIIPGTKTTVADLDYLRRTGMAEGIAQLARGGTAVVGICGGYQMLGTRVLDPERVESDSEASEGLGILPVVTRFSPRKETHVVAGTVSADLHGMLQDASGMSVEGYEIHMGGTESDGGPEAPTAPFRLLGRAGAAAGVMDGSITADGWVMGTYLHGLFHNTGLRRAILGQIAKRKGVSLEFPSDDFSQDREYDRLADLVRANVRLDAVYEAMELESPVRTRRH